MSCRRGCYHGADWPAHFYCPTTRLTFEPQQAIVVDHKRVHQKSDSAMARTREPASYMCRTRGATELQIPLNTTSTTIMPFMSAWKGKKMPQWLQSARPKRRVHSPPEAFLSLIRGASSCLQPKPAHRHDGRPAHKHWAQAQSYSFISDSRWLHFPSGSYTGDAKFSVTATVWSYRKGSVFLRNNKAHPKIKNTHFSAYL